jgi:hypothetical protein
MAPPEDMFPEPSLLSNVLLPVSLMVLTKMLLIYAPINLYPVKKEAILCSALPPTTGLLAPKFA